MTEKDYGYRHGSGWEFFRCRGGVRGVQGWFWPRWRVWDQGWQVEAGPFVLRYWKRGHR